MDNTEVVERKCDQDIYTRGTKIFETTGYEVGVKFMSYWVGKIAKLSGERVDFHKSGNCTWVVKAVGNISQVEKIIQEIKPEYDKYSIQQSTIQRLMDITHGLKGLNEIQYNLLMEKNAINRRLERIEDDKTKTNKEQIELTEKLYRLLEYR